MIAANNISKDQIMTDKSIPSPASVDSVMNLAYEWASRKVLQAQNRPHASVLGALSDLRAEVSRLATGRADTPDAEIVTLTLEDGKKAKVIRALDLKWIARVPNGTKLYAALPAAPGAAQGEVN